MKSITSHSSLHLFRWCFVLLCAAVSIGCGGGGGGGGTPAPTPTPTPTPAPTVTISSSSSSASVDSAVTISWSSTNASSCTASGAWSGSRATSGSESFTLSAADDYSFTLACSGSGGNGSASVTVNGYQTFNGVTVDGYIRLADIFIDENNNFTRDTGENNTTSDSGGKFTSLRYTPGNLVSAGGVDVDSGNLLDQLLLVNKLSEHNDLLVVTPVTSVAALMVNPDNIKAALGIDDSINIATTDPIATMADGDQYEYLYEKGSQITALVFSMQSALNEINSLTETSETYFSEFAKILEAQYTEGTKTVDIEAEAFIDAYVDAVLVTKATSLQGNDETDIKNALHSIVPVISVRNNAAITTAIANFATGKFITDFKAMAQGTASTALAFSYATDINALIAADQSIEPGDLTIDISLADDIATVDEDSSVDIAVLSNDTYTTPVYGFSIATSAPSNGQVLSNADNTLSYVPNANFNGADAFTYTVTVDDRSATANVSVTVNPVNDAPAISGLSSSISVAENLTSVVTVSASDVDEDDLTYTLTGTDSASLSISSSGAITFNSPPDYETKATYSVTVNVSDGTNTTPQALTITITSVNEGAPVITSSATFSVPENQTAVGTVTATDADTGDTLTYTLTGTDASSLSINSSGVITFNSAPDYETKTSYSVTVNVSDGTNTTPQALTITITSVNEGAPVITSSATFSAAENQTGVGTVTATDADDDTLTYTLTGTDASSLSIHSSSGVITFNSAPDYETKTSYSVTVNVSDGTETTPQALTITITSVNEYSPVISGLASSVSVPENQTSVITVSATDGDAGETLTYTLTGTDASSLNINSLGVIIFVNSAPDYETKTSYSVTVNVSDGTNTASQALTITISNVNEYSPVISGLASLVSVPENQTAVGTVTATDADGETLTYTLTGTDEASLSISSSGVITFDSAPDYETKTAYSVTVNVSDGTNTTTQALTITITNANDNDPVITSSSTFGAAENQTAVGTVTATDADGETLTYTLTGTDEASLSISSSGVITFDSAPDYETKTAYSVTVNVSDGTNTTTQALTITISNVNEYSPVITSSSTFSAAENQTAVGTVTATDADGGSVIYSLTGTDASSLSINASTGVITFDSAPDYETKTSYSVTVNVSDGTNTTPQALTITITNANDNDPVITSSSTFGAAENQTAVGTVTATDADGETLTYTLTGTDEASLSISSLGVITFDSAPDYETKTAYSVTVNVSDGTNTTTQALTITISNVNDSWTQRGSDIDGEEGRTSPVNPGDHSGDTLSISNDGDMVLIGARAYGHLSGNWQPYGHARIFDWNGSAWAQRGTHILGETNGDNAGESVSISDNKNTVAISSPEVDGNGGSSGTRHGHVRIFDWNGSAWAQRGSSIIGEAVNDYSGRGRNVSLSDDGDTVAIGATGNDGGDGNPENDPGDLGLGHVRIYDWNGSAWAQRGSDIDGETGDRSGRSVSLSKDGDTVAIGGRGHDGGAGGLRIFDWNGSAWAQRGADTNGEAPNDTCGTEASLGNDSNTVAISCGGNTSSDTGIVRIYDWNGSAWAKKGSDLNGEASSDQAISVSMSDDGKTVVIGAFGNDGNGTDSGHTRIYDWDGNAWAQRGSDIDGEAAGDQSGFQVDISDDGNTIATGARKNDGNGENAGHVRIYDWN